MAPPRRPTAAIERSATQGQSTLESSENSFSIMPFGDPGDDQQLRQRAQHHQQQHEHFPQMFPAQQPLDQTAQTRGQQQIEYDENQQRREDSRRSGPPAEERIPKQPDRARPSGSEASRIPW